MLAVATGVLIGAGCIKALIVKLLVPCVLISVDVACVGDLSTSTLPTVVCVAANTATPDPELWLFDAKPMELVLLLVVVVLLAILCAVKSLAIASACCCADDADCAAADSAACTTDFASLPILV